MRALDILEERGTSLTGDDYTQRKIYNANQGLKSPDCGKMDEWIVGIMAQNRPPRRRLG